MIGHHPYRKKRSYNLAIVIILLAIFISFSAFQNLFGLRSLLQSALYPFQFAAVSLWKGVLNVPASLSSFRKVSKQNAELKEELKNLQPKLAVLDGLIKENNRLREALFFKERNPYRFRLLAAQVVGKSPDPWFSILEVSQGSRAGIRIDMPVMVKEGLVGRVVEVSKFSSKIMLITDAESSIAAVDARSRDFGLVKGGSVDKLFMKYVDAGGDIGMGDSIVTSHISTVFPPGIPIGEVSQATKKEHDLFYHIEIKPAVDFSKIEEVFIIL